MTSTSTSTATCTPAAPAPAPASALTPALFKRLHPRPYLDRFLSQDIRPDGRSLSESDSEGTNWRDCSVNIGSISTCPASSLVRLGRTTLLCGLTLEIAPPSLAAPYDGFIVPNVDLPPLCSPLFKAGPPADEAQVLSLRLREILLASGILPLEQLCIEPGKAAFVVYLDVVCLNYDGATLDAAVLACCGALRNLRLPKANWDPDTQSTICEPLDPTTSTSPPPPPPRPLLELGHLPLSVTFGLFNGHLLPDPTLFESTLCDTILTIVLSSSGSKKLLHVYQAGAPLEGEAGGRREVLKRCIAMARRRAGELRKVLEEQ